MRFPNGYGSISKLKDKPRRRPFRVRITKGFDDDGKQTFINLGYFSNQEEAIQALQEYNSSPYDISKNQITFSEVFNKWSISHFKNVSDSAITNYKNAFNRYCHSLYKLRMKDIRLTHLQAVIDNCGMAHPTRAMIKTLFNVLFKFSMKNDIVEKDYATYVDVGHREGKVNRKPFTTEEIQTLWDNVDKLSFVDTILIMIYTSMRVGELLDIKIENVHLDERYMIGGLKTKAGINRIIPINKKIEPFIRKYYEQNKDCKYLITNAFDRQMQYSNYRREKFDNIMEKLRMEHCPHDCRHTGISLLNSANANPLCIKRIVGHSSQDITEDVYTHKSIDELIATIDLI
ncbi:MAG: site-specific integrase [Oscillospiraceae bacterium]|nr:site-specific integrase [Oscillospiraceae bacterium]